MVNHTSSARGRCGRAGPRGGAPQPWLGASLKLESVTAIPAASPRLEVRIRGRCSDIKTAASALDLTVIAAESTAGAAEVSPRISPAPVRVLAAASQRTDDWALCRRRTSSCANATGMTNNFLNGRNTAAAIGCRRKEVAVWHRRHHYQKSLMPRLVQHPKNISGLTDGPKPGCCARHHDDRSRLEKRARGRSDLMDHSRSAE